MKESDKIIQEIANSFNIIRGDCMTGEEKQLLYGVFGALLCLTVMVVDGCHKVVEENLVYYQIKTVIAPIKAEYNKAVAIECLKNY